MGNEQAKSVQNHRYPSGNVYSGEMVGGKRQGQGTLTWPDGATYEGGWLNDLCEGKGHMQFPNGSIYEGGFVRNNPCGSGKLTTVNGEVVEGFWEYQGRSDTSSVAVGKYSFHGELLDLKTGQRRSLVGPLALYLQSGLVSLPNMPDPMESIFPYAAILSSGDDKATLANPALAEEGRALFQEGLIAGDVPIAHVVQTAPSTSSSISYGQAEPALQSRHRDDHAAYSLLDPRLYLNSLGVPIQPTNINQQKQDALRYQRAFGSHPSAHVPVAQPVQGVEQSRPVMF